MSDALSDAEKGKGPLRGEGGVALEMTTFQEKQDTDSSEEGSTGRPERSDDGSAKSDTLLGTSEHSPGDVVNMEKKKQLKSDPAAHKEDFSGAEEMEDLDEPCSSKFLKENEAEGSPSRNVRRQSSEDAGNGDEDVEFLSEQAAEEDIYEYFRQFWQLTEMQAEEGRNPGMKRMVVFSDSTDAKEEERERKREAKERDEAEKLEKKKKKEARYQNLSPPEKVFYRIVEMRDKVKALSLWWKFGLPLGVVALAAVIYVVYINWGSLSERLSRSHISPTDHRKLFDPDFRA